jgi:arylsulfatase A-like enzyme
MPPHAPYAPAAEFDRFTDPGYEGPCDGSHRTINRLDAGRLSPGEGCLDQVIALYDGGLLAADASVGRLLDALRNRPRWKTTVVLITSDHGEAFLEHGRTSHNSTVYDEMLHVPFILRVPEGFDRSGVDTDRLATLADILPTLLSVTPMQPPQGIEGVDLLNRPDPTRSSDRYFVTRTTGAAPTFGLRTRNWKLILPGSGHGALFNLTKDPLERQNRRFVNRPVYLTLGQLLTTRLASPPSAIQPVEKREISETDREMLEALGYVE